MVRGRARQKIASSDLAKKIDAFANDPAVDEVDQALAPHVAAIRRVFQYYSQIGPVGGQKILAELSLGQFKRFVKDMRVIGQLPAGVQGVPLMGAAIAIIFTSANKEADGLDSEGTGGNMMVHFEWVYALARIAWDMFPQGGLTQRFDTLMRKFLVPFVLDPLVGPEPALPEHFTSAKVRAVLTYFEPMLRNIFDYYARADVNASSRNLALCGTMSVQEYTQLLSQGGLICEDLTMKRATAAFNQVSSLFLGDANEMELNFEMFCAVLTSLCVTSEPDIQFAATFARWMQSSFIPKFGFVIAQRHRSSIERHRSSISTNMSGTT